MRDPGLKFCLINSLSSYLGCSIGFPKELALSYQRILTLTKITNCYQMLLFTELNVVAIP